MLARGLLKTAAWRVAPGVMADRARDYETGFRASVGLTALAERFAAIHGDRVLHGPVAGLRLLVSPRLGEIDHGAAKLLGTYEEEIHPALQRAIGAGPERFVDLGSADGYYAVGVALVAQVPVDAFDLSKRARSLTQESAAVNGVSHLVTTHGAANARSVGQLPLTNALVLCDVEGAERDIFTPELLTKLNRARVIVELHTRARPGVECFLAELLDATHDVSMVDARPRDPATYEELEMFEDVADRERAIDELRYRDDGLRWLIAEPL